MGWFEEQVKKRRKLDEETFNDSFMSLAGLNSNKEPDLNEKQNIENTAIKQILSYFRHTMVDIPHNIKNFKDKLNYALSRYEISYRKVELNNEYVTDYNSPLLIISVYNDTPIVLFPLGKKYVYYHPKKRKFLKINASSVNRFEAEGYTFYRPLPKTKISIKEYSKYIFKSIRLIDIILLILFAAIVSGVGLFLPMLTKRLTGEVINSKDMNLFISTSLFVASAATGLLVVKAIQGFINSRISIKIEKSVQEATMMKLLSLPTSFFKKYNTGELSTRFSSVTQLANIILSGLLMTVISVVMSLAYLFQLIGFTPVLVVPVILILITSSAFSIFISILQKKYRKKQLELESKESGVTYELINGIQKIRLSGSEKRVFAKWANIYSKAAKIKYNPPLILRLSTAISLAITLIGNIIIYFIAAKNNIDASSYMAFTTSFGILSSAFTALTQVVDLGALVKPTFDMARPLLEAIPENNDAKIKIENINGNIKLNNVSFKYTETGPLILDNLSLNIKEGEYIAIVGQTGCGKSTLVRILLGFEEPINGEVLYDNINIKDVELSSLRRNIGTVLQNGTLFHADIYSNIIISSPDLTEEDAWHAAEIANIANDIQDMPMKMKTVISEGQGGISGGQKQRIMIARAIVHKPKILIFDEATSALDNKTQKSISDSIAKLNCTRIVIAHRLSTIKNADRIIMLEGGSIIEEGDYDSLIAKKGKFAELVDRQRLDNK